MSPAELIAENNKLKESLDVFAKQLIFHGQVSVDQAKHREAIREKLVLIAQALGVQAPMSTEGETIARTWERFADLIVEAAQKTKQP